MQGTGATELGQPHREVPRVGLVGAVEFLDVSLPQAGVVVVGVHRGLPGQLKRIELFTV